MLSTMASYTSMCWHPMHDIFFISYNEPNADENWQILSSRMPHARRVHGITGISNAHRRCAELSYTAMFWTVDADTVVDESFGFEYGVPYYDRKYLHLWNSRNPVNGLEYGYGSVKLWPRKLVIAFHGHWLDFTTTVGNIKMMDNTIATTMFNTDPYGAWKSGFRETIKLLHSMQTGNDADSVDRALAWLNRKNDVQFADDTVLGARHALAYFLDHRGDPGSLAVINVFSELERLHPLSGTIGVTGEIDRIELLNKVKLSHA